MASVKEVYERAVKVIDSCESMTLFSCTERYVELSIRRLEKMACCSLDLHWNGRLLKDINDKIYDLRKRLRNKNFM